MTAPTPAQRNAAAAEILAHFRDLEDPRSPINRRHPLPSVLLIAIMAVLAGAAGPTAIARWALFKADFLALILDLPYGIPGKDVFRRVLMAIKPAAFQVCFVAWLDSVRKTALADAACDREVLAIDGKTARRSHDHANGLGPLHAVTVYASDLGLALAQVACAEKSNEITAIPKALAAVDITGAIVTIDAMGTQKEIAKKIVDGGADYVLALKGNQGTLHDSVMAHINGAQENDFAGVEVERHETQEKGHGREEKRTCIQMEIPAGLKGSAAWAGLATIAVAVLECVRGGKTTTECRYFISSLPMGVKTMAGAIRSHWGIENGCHWCLDVTFGEDHSRTRAIHLRENVAWLNRLALSLLKQHHVGRMSVAMKRRSCGWSEDFLLQVLTGAHI